MKTYIMLKQLFYKTDDIDLNYIADLIDNKCVRFGLDTPLRIAHFLAQVREEVGANFKPIVENLNYSEDSLKETFNSFKENPELANLYGRNASHDANQEMIGNIAYGNRLGNGDVGSGDGFRFRGSGCLQITGKYNYTEVQKRIEKYSGEKLDITNGHDIHSLKGFILAGAAFWIWKDIYNKADLGVSDFAADECTKIINVHTDSYNKRRQHFNAIKHLI